MPIDTTGFLYETYTARSYDGTELSPVEVLIVPMDLARTPLLSNNPTGDKRAPIDKNGSQFGDYNKPMNLKEIVNHLVIPQSGMINDEATLAARLEYALSMPRLLKNCNAAARTYKSLSARLIIQGQKPTLDQEIIDYIPFSGERIEALDDDDYIASISAAKLYAERVFSINSNRFEGAMKEGLLSFYINGDIPVFYRQYHLMLFKVKDVNAAFSR